MTSDVRSPTPPPPPASSGNIQTQTSAVSAPLRPRTLMETLLVAKMEKAGACLTSSSPPSPLPALLLRTDSTDSASSLSSTSSDVCRCDDCLLGIADLYISSPEEEARSRRKVTDCHWMCASAERQVSSYNDLTFKMFMFCCCE